jgi:hypothetical protein
LHSVVLDFNSKCIEYARGGIRRPIAFSQSVEAEACEVGQVKDSSLCSNIQYRRYCSPSRTADTTVSLSSSDELDGSIASEANVLERSSFVLMLMYGVNAKLLMR